MILEPHTLISLIESYKSLYDEYSTDIDNLLWDSDIADSNDNVLSESLHAEKIFSQSHILEIIRRLQSLLDPVSQLEGSQHTVKKLIRGEPI